MSSIAIFLVLGGATAVAAKKIGKNQLKANSVTTAKIKKNAVTTRKLRNNAVTTNKIRNEAVTGAKVNEASLGTVPSAANSVTTDEVVSSKGTLGLGQAATIFEHAGVRLIVNCEAYEPAATPEITARVYIESSTDGTTFLSWLDAGKSIGPATPATDREVTHPGWGNSDGPMEGEAGAPINVTTASGASFAGTVGVASEKDSNTCWYWFHGTIIS
jgi:hypothetical protein